MKWKKIASAPKTKGIFLAKTKEGLKFITEYRPDQVDGDGCYGMIDSCCGSYEDMKPVAWARI